MSRSPPGPLPDRSLGGLCTSEPRCLRRPVSGDAGRGSLGLAGTKLKHEPKTSLPYGGLILGSAAPSRGHNPRPIPLHTPTPPTLNPLPAPPSSAAPSATPPPLP